MPTNRTFVRQVQLTGSLAQSDNISFATRDDVVSGSLEHDLNAMRTVIRKMLGTAPDDGSSFSQGWWYTDAANGVSLSTLNTAISGTFQINELYVSGSASHSVISGSAWIESLAVGDGSTGMVVEGDTLEVTGSMFVSSSLQVSGAVKFDLIDDLTTPETSMFQVFSPDGTRVFMVSGSTGGSFMVLSGSDGGGATSGINLVGGNSSWSTFETNFGANTSIIEAFNFLVTTGVEHKGTLNTTGGVVADTPIDVNVNNYTYLGTSNGGDPALHMDVFVNGLFMSGTTGFVTDDSDWYSTNDANAPLSTVANQIAFNFDIDNQDIVQVVLRKAQQVV